MLGRLRARGRQGLCLETGPARSVKTYTQRSLATLCFITLWWSFPGAARTTYPSLGGLHHSLVSRCWRLEVRDQGAGWLSSFRGPRGAACPRLLTTLWDVPWLVGASHDPQLLTVCVRGPILPLHQGPSRGFPDGPEAKTPRSQSKALGSVPGQGTRSHLLQLRPSAAK